MFLSLPDVVTQAVQRGASDIHLVQGLPIRIRVDGQLEDLDGLPLSPQDCEEFAENLAGDAYSSIARMGELDLARTFPGEVRCRINLFRQQGGVSAAIRILADRIPQLEKLGLPPAVMEFPGYRRGLVLVTGETGSGKSTTLAAILDRVNHTRRAHIITLEDPIEYVYTPDLCVINQREIGRDTASYADGLRSILREDPDVILIGEMRDLNTIETALTAAETGHLVLATLHTNSAAEAIDRVVDVFPEGQQRQIRLQLSNVLMAVLSQQLLPRMIGGGRVAACELMVVTPAIRNLIREAKTPQISNALSTSASEGSVTMDNYILKLYKDRVISSMIARQYARDPDYMKRSTLP